MVIMNEPATPEARVSMLAARLAIDPADVRDALDLTDVAAASEVLAGHRELQPSSLVCLADLFNVPITVLTGEVPLDGHLGVSLRLGMLDPLDAPLDALQTADQMLAHQAVLDSWMGELPRPLDSVQMSTDGFYIRAGQVSAERVRAGLELGTEPIPELVGLVESLGFPVVFLALPAQLWGLNVRDQREGRPSRLIIISTESGWAQQRYTLAHELCHALYDDTDQLIVDRVEVPNRLPEKRAESFARHLLLPVAALQAVTTARLHDGAAWPAIVSDVMMTFGISRLATLIALVEDGLMPLAEREALETTGVEAMLAAAGYAEQWAQLTQAAAVPAGSPVLVERALEAYGSGLVNVRVVADLLGQDLADTEEMLASQGW